MITPADSNSAPAQYDAVAVSTQDIQAPQADLAGAMSAAVAEAMSRQGPTETLISSEPGYGDFDIMSGYTGTWGTVSDPDVDGP